MMPQMGADMTEGTVVALAQAGGRAGTRGDIIAEIETDKATVELEAFESGTLLKQLWLKAKTVPVGEVIAILGDASEAVPDIEAQAAGGDASRTGGPSGAPRDRRTAPRSQRARRNLNQRRPRQATSPS